VPTCISATSRSRAGVLAGPSRQLTTRRSKRSSSRPDNRRAERASRAPEQRHPPGPALPHGHEFIAHQQDARRKRHLGDRSGHPDDIPLQWLADVVEQQWVELADLVEEQHAVVGQRSGMTPERREVAYEPSMPSRVATRPSRLVTLASSVGSGMELCPPCPAPGGVRLAGALLWLTSVAHMEDELAGGRGFHGNELHPTLFLGERCRCGDATGRPESTLRGTDPPT
jgi:hypothetical protein